MATKKVGKTTTISTPLLLVSLLDPGFEIRDGQKSSGSGMDSHPRIRTTWLGGGGAHLFRVVGGGVNWHWLKFLFYLFKIK